MKRISIFGATGSVGRGAADVVLANPDIFRVQTVTAHKNAGALAVLAKDLGAQRAVIADETYYAALKDALSGTGIEVAAGEAALLDAARENVDVHVAAIVGMAGIGPIMAAMGHARSIAVANKEPLVAAGEIVLAAARKTGTKILPVDSEHNAIFQVFEEGNRAAIRRLILTASGGPFRDWTMEQMRAATPAQAVAHPNWSMGAKISVDSASMMNKALEVIEAHHLFAMPADRIDVLIHPQSIIHSMVEYADGSVLAQMGAPDMRTPIAYAMGWPDRIDGPSHRLDFSALSALTFAPVDDRRFPAIKLAYDSLQAGGGACLALNAANEVAVAAFLDGRIGFIDIFETVRETVEKAGAQAPQDLEVALALDTKVRDLAKSIILARNTSNRKVS